jgi:hypothetical protein
MTFARFIQSSTESQDQAIQKAVVIATRVDPPFHFTLLQLDSFYIELKHDDNSHKTSLNAFENPDQLDPYLDNIALP